MIPLGLGFLRARAQSRVTIGARTVFWLRHQNTRLLDLVIKHPRLSLSCCVIFLLLCLAGLVLVPINFLPLPNEGVLLESFTLPPGSSLLEAEAVVARITDALHHDRWSRPMRGLDRRRPARTPNSRMPVKYRSCSGPELGHIRSTRSPLAHRLRAR